MVSSRKWKNGHTGLLERSGLKFQLHWELGHKAKGSGLFSRRGDISEADPFLSILCSHMHRLLTSPGDSRHYSDCFSQRSAWHACFKLQAFSVVLVFFHLGTQVLLFLLHGKNFLRESKWDSGQEDMLREERTCLGKNKAYTEWSFCSSSEVTACRMQTTCSEKLAGKYHQ